LYEVCVTIAGNEFQKQTFAPRISDGLRAGTRDEAAVVLVEESLLVHFLEVKRIVESELQAGILEFFAPDVEGEGLPFRPYRCVAL
jgi:hypothetical protein